MTERQSWTDSDIRTLYRVCRTNPNSIWEHFPERSVDSIMYAIRRYDQLNETYVFNRRNYVNIPANWMRIWVEEQTELKNKLIEENIYYSRLLVDAFVIFLGLCVLYHINFDTPYEEPITDTQWNVFDVDDWL
jgi:hypothetical protein